MAVLKSLGLDDPEVAKRVNALLRDKAAWCYRVGTYGWELERLRRRRANIDRMRTERLAHRAKKLATVAYFTGPERLDEQGLLPLWNGP